jgi:hypothetical protein
MSRKYTRKEKIAILGYTAVLLMGFLPWGTFDGKTAGVIGMIVYGLNGGLGEPGPTNPFFIWAIITIATYSINVIQLYRLIKRRPMGSIEQISIYVGTSITIVLYVALYVITWIEYMKMKFLPYIPARIVLQGIMFLYWRAANDDEVARSQEAELEKAKKTAGQAYVAPSRWFRLAASAVFLIDFFAAKWIAFDRSYTLPQLFSAIAEAGGTDAFLNGIRSDVSGMDLTTLSMMCSIAYIIAAIAVILVIRAVMILMKKKTIRISNIIYALAFLYIVFFMVFSDRIYHRYGLIVGLLTIAADGLVGRYLDDREELRKRAAELRERNRLAKEERMRREAFPGRFKPEFYRLIFKNFRYNIMDYMMFIIGAVSVMTVYTVIFGIEDSLGGTGTEGMEYYQQNILVMTYKLMPMFMFLSVLLLSMILTGYIRTRMKNYTVYNSLGIRRKTLRMIIGAEYVTCILITLAGGSAIGALIMAATGLDYDAGHVFLISAGVFFLTVLISTLVNYHMFEYQNILSLSESEAAERIPAKYMKIVAAAGAAVVIYAVVRYSSIYSGESFLLIVAALVGLFLIIFGAASVIVRSRVKKASDESTVPLKMLQWRWRFRTSVRYTYLLIALGFFAFATFIPNLAAYVSAPSTEELFPYDFTAMVHDDDSAAVKKIKAIRDTDVSEYRMLRATTPLGAPSSLSTSNYQEVVFPQGQHVAISESEYRRLERSAGLKPEKLDLKGSKVHFVVQQDMSAQAHPFEWFSDGSGNLFRLGQPLTMYDTNLRDKIFTPHEATYERSILTGSFLGGQQENIVVISDSLFNKVYAQKDQTGAKYGAQAPSESKEGPTHLLLIKCGSSEAKSAVRAELKKLEVKNKYDTRFDSTIHTYYEKAPQKASEGRHFSEILYSIITAGLLIMSIFIFSVRYALGVHEMRDEYDLLGTIGMAPADMRRMFRRGLRMNIYPVWLAATVLAVPFVILMMHVRMFTASETAAFLKCFVPMYAGYSAAYIVVLEIISRHFMKAVIKWK